MPTDCAAGGKKERRRGTRYLLAVVVLLSGREGRAGTPFGVSLYFPSPIGPIPLTALSLGRSFHESRAVQPVMLFIRCGRSRSAFILVHSLHSRRLSLSRFLSRSTSGSSPHSYLPRHLSFSPCAAAYIGLNIAILASSIVRVATLPFFCTADLQ